MIRTLLSLLPDGSRRVVTWHLALSVSGVIFRAAGAVILVPLVAALFGEDPARAWPWVGALVLVTAAGWVVDGLAARLAFRLGFDLLDSGQRTVAEHISRIRLTWFSAENTATTRQAVAATGPDLVGIVIYLVTPLLGAALLPLAIAVALLPIAWQLGLAALAGVTLLLGAFWASGRLGRDADRAAADANTALTERIVEFGRTQQALRAARRVDPAHSRVGQALEAHHGASIRLLLLQIPGTLLFTLASQLALLGLAATIVLLTVHGRLSVPEAIALVVVVVRYLEPFTVLAELSHGIEATTIALRRIRTVLAAPTTPAGTDDGGYLAGTAGADPASAAPTVELRGVRFGYGTDEPVLDGIDLVLQPGSTTAIVGPSGSGKSTVLGLLAGLHPPDAGRIVIGGTDVSTLTGEARRSLVSMVLQEPYLFEGSLRENVLVGDPNAGEDALDRAAGLARIDSLIDELPDGWDTTIGESGSTLSGGERQRVSIARALIKPAPVLLVDEATSALDAVNDVAVSAALSDDPVPRTRIIVAHRLSSIRAADRVVFLDGGRIVEDGTPDELRAAGGRFAEFWRQQDAAGAWRLGARA